jgi:hypothetical protein
LAGHLDGSFDEAPIHLRLNKSLAEGYQCSFTERCLLGVQTIQHQLPAPIHHRRLNHFVIGDTGVRLQDERQRQYRRGYRRLPSLRFAIQTRQLLLKRFIQQFVSVLTQKHKEFRFPNLLHNLLFLL